MGLRTYSIVIKAVNLPVTRLPIYSGHIKLISAWMGKGRWIDNVFIERLWRSLKYEEVYLNACDTVAQRVTSRRFSV